MFSYHNWSSILKAYRDSHILNYNTIRSIIDSFEDTIDPQSDWRAMSRNTRWDLTSDTILQSSLDDNAVSTPTIGEQ